MYDKTHGRRTGAICDGGDGRFGSGSLVVVSNRQPYRHTTDDDGNVEVDRPTGGLTAGLDPAIRQTGGTWIAWGDGDADGRVVDAADRVSVPPEDPGYVLRRVWLADEQVEGYYYGFANQVLWPLCHAALGTVRAEPDWWHEYCRTNRQFAAVVAEEADRDDTVWFHDYHLALAPGMVRRELGRGPTLMHFWHVPWPAWDVYRACPHGAELLRGLLANDVVGFHVPRYRHNFLECVDASLEDATVDRDAGEVHYRGARTGVEAVPMGVPFGKIDRQAGTRTVEDVRAIAPEIPTDVHLAVGVDRLDYTKGVVERLVALERFWETYPEWRESLTFVQNASESRSEIPAYKRVQDRVTDRVERINRRFGTEDWQPVVYLTDTVDQERLYGLYRHADVGVVSAIRDGLNLVALEYVAAQVDRGGALLLGEGAGSHDLLGEWAYSVSPFDPDGMASTLAEALSAPCTERQRRMEHLRRAVADADLASWLQRHADLAGTTARTGARRVSHDAV